MGSHLLISFVKILKPNSYNTSNYHKMKKIAILSVIAFFGLITNSFAQNVPADIVSSVVSNLVSNPSVSSVQCPVASALNSLGLGDGLYPSSAVTTSEDGKTSTYTASNGNAVTLTNNGTSNTIAVNVPAGGKLPVGLNSSLGGNPVVTKSTGDVKATIVSTDGKTNVKVYKDGHIEFSKTADAKCSM